MKVLVVGSGGREHALCWKLAQSEQVEKIFCAPGNGGTALERKTSNVPIAATDLEDLRNFALEEKIDLTVVGPEVPLALGITDFFNERGLLVFGPTKAAARLESCKIFAKELMIEAGIMTPPAFIAYDVATARGYIHHHFFHHEGEPLVVKADGLAQGKGSSVCRSEKEAFDFIHACIVDKIFGDAGTAVLLEKYLPGEEATLHCLIDGERIRLLGTAQDEKRLWDGIDAPMTGGMGATSPSPIIEASKIYIQLHIIQPLIAVLKKRRIVYRGVLYLGLMVSRGNIYVLEFNCRFGDPEGEAVLVRLKSDLFPLLYATAQGDLAGQSVEWEDTCAATVVMAARGYPKASTMTGLSIRGLRQAEQVPGTVIFHASTVVNEQDGTFLTGEGGRVLAVTTTASSWGETIGNVYQAVREIDWGPRKRFVTEQKSDPWGPNMDDLRKSTDPGPYCRWDIGRKLLTES